MVHVLFVAPEIDGWQQGATGLYRYIVNGLYGTIIDVSISSQPLFTNLLFYVDDAINIFGQIMAISDMSIRD